MSSVTDHSDDEIGTLGEFLTGRGWTLVRVETERGRDVGIYEKQGRVLRAGAALRIEWDEKQEATK